jgi:butyryl-CoA dehydrogenase
MVLGGPGAQALVVSACIADRSDLGLFLLPADGLGQRLVAKTLFDGQQAAELTMDQAEGAVLLCRGERAGILNHLERAIERAALAHCADTVGAMARAFDLTRDYLGTRSQFGKTLATNQVIQHRLVDLYVEIEEARALIRKTASLFDNADIETASERRRYVAAVKAFTAQAARHVWEESVQLHGAIGMTQECAVGAFVKRLALAVSLYGDEAFHLQRVASVSLDGAALAARLPQETASVPAC